MRIHVGVKLQIHCLLVLESIDISNLKTVSFRTSLQWVAMYTWLSCFFFFHAVPIVLHKKKHGHETKKEMVVFILQCSLLSQTLPKATSATLTLLNFAHMHLQNMKTERPWTLRRPHFGWFELMLEDESQSCYWKDHCGMCKDTFLRLVNLVSPEISRRNTRLRKAIPSAKRVAIALWGWKLSRSFFTLWCGKVILYYNHQRILPRAEQIFKAFC